MQRRVLALSLLLPLLLAPWAASGDLLAPVVTRSSAEAGDAPLSWSGWVSPDHPETSAHRVAVSAATWSPSLESTPTAAWPTWQATLEPTAQPAEPTWWGPYGGPLLLQYAEGADLEAAWADLPAGLRLGAAMPGLSLLVWADTAAAVDDAIAGASTNGLVAALPWHDGLRSRAVWASNATSPASWEVTLQPDLPPIALAATLDHLRATDPKLELAGGTSLYADLTPAALADLIRDPAILHLMPEPDWVELSARSSEILGVNASRDGTGWDNIARGWLDGTGQVACVMDTGLDVNHPDIPDNNSSRLISTYDYNGDGIGDNASGHGTHVAGTVLGNGSASNGIVRGQAYNASLIFQAIDGPGAGLDPPSDLTDGFDDCRNDGGHLQTNSWGGGPGPAYDSRARAVDVYTRQHSDFIILFAVGNSGPAFNSVQNPAMNKNGMGIGASENEWPEYAYTYADYPNSRWTGAPWGNDSMADDREGMAAFSSRGSVYPSYLGKPDVVAPGTWVLAARSAGETTAASTYSDWEGPGNLSDDYQFLSGTSMATPNTAGTILLLRQALIANGTTPSNLLLKGLTIHGASPMKGQFAGSQGDVDGFQSGSRNTGQWNTPDPNMGWGRVNLTRMLSPAPGDERLMWNVSLNTTDRTWSQRIVHTGGSPLSLTMLWNDPAASVGTNNTTVHDLDLELIAPNGSVYWGNVFDDNVSEADVGDDRYREWADVVERIWLPNAAAGSWEIRLNGRLLTQGSEDALILLDAAIDPRTDLVANLTVTPTDPFRGDTCTLAWSVTNDGPVTAPAFDVDLWRGNDSTVIEQASRSLAPWTQTNGTRLVVCDQPMDTFGMSISTALEQRDLLNDVAIVNITTRVLDLGIAITDPTSVAQNGTALAGLYLWNNGTEVIPLDFGVSGATDGLQVSGLPTSTFDLPLGALQTPMVITVEADSDAQPGVHELILEITSAARPGWQRNHTWRVIVQATSDLAWGIVNESSFLSPADTTISLSVNLTNQKNVSDLATLRIETDLDWGLTWAVSADPFTGGTLAFAAGQLRWVDLQVRVPKVIDGVPLANVPQRFSIIAASALDGAETTYRFNIRLLAFHNVTIDGEDSAISVDPGSQGEVALRLRNTGNAPQGLSVQLELTDALGQPLGANISQRIAHQGWTAAVFNDFTVAYLEPNRTGLVNIRVQAPPTNSGELHLRVLVNGFQGDQGQQTVAMSTTIVWTRGGVLSAFEDDCGVTAPSETCLLGLDVENLGNAADSFELALVDVPTWLNATLDSTALVRGLDENASAGLLRLRPLADAAAAAEATVGVELRLFGASTAIDRVNVTIEVARITGWSMVLTDRLDDGMLVIDVALTNTGNGRDGVYVDLSRDVSSTASLVMPTGATTDDEADPPSSFTLLDQAPGALVIFTARLAPPSNAPANGTMTLTISASSTTDGSTEVSESRTAPYAGGGTRTDDEAGDSVFSTIREAGVDAWNGYASVLIALMAFVLMLPVVGYAHRRRQRKDLAHQENNPFFEGPMTTPTAEFGASPQKEATLDEWQARFSKPAIEPNSLRDSDPLSGGVVAPPPAGGGVDAWQQRLQAPAAAPVAVAAPATFAPPAYTPPVPSATPPAPAPAAYAPPVATPPAQVAAPPPAAAHAPPVTPPAPAPVVPTSPPPAQVTAANALLDQHDGQRLDQDLDGLAGDLMAARVPTQASAADHHHPVVQDDLDL